MCCIKVHVPCEWCFDRKSLPVVADDMIFHFNKTLVCWAWSCGNVTVCCPCGQWHSHIFWGPGQVIIMATPNRNYEILKNHNYFLNFLLFYLSNGLNLEASKWYPEVPHFFFVTVTIAEVVNTALLIQKINVFCFHSMQSKRVGSIICNTVNCCHLIKKFTEVYLLCSFLHHQIWYLNLLVINIHVW